MTYCIIMLGDCALRLEKGAKTARSGGLCGKFFPACSQYYTAFCGACKGGRGAFCGTISDISIFIDEKIYSVDRGWINNETRRSILTDELTHSKVR